MHFRRLGVSLALFSAAAGSAALAAADVSMLNLLMPDAKVVTGVDVERTRNSPFGQYLIQQMTAKDAGLEKFTEMTGLDPRKDLFEVILASSDSGVSLHASAGAVVVMRGAFNPSKLTQLAGAHGTVTSYNGTQVLETGKGAASAWVGFLGNVMVAGPPTSVKTAIDRYRSAKNIDALLASRVQAASSKHDAWFLTTVSPGALAGNLSSNPDVKGAMTGDLMQGIESLSGGVKFGANVIVSGEATARSNQDATALVDVLRFFATMAQSNGAKSGPMSMLNAVQMTAEGKTVKFSLTTPEQDFEKLFMPGMNRVKARARVALD